MGNNPSFEHAECVLTFPKKFIFIKKKEHKASGYLYTYYYPYKKCDIWKDNNNYDSLVFKIRDLNGIITLGIKLVPEDLKIKYINNNTYIYELEHHLDNGEFYYLRFTKEKYIKELVRVNTQ
jgi:hypothetical protein